MDQRPLLSGQPLSPSTILSERTQCSSAAPCLFSASIFNNSTAKNQNRIYEPEKPEKNPLVGATVHLKGKMGEKKITTMRLLFFFNPSTETPCPFWPTSTALLRQHRGSHPHTAGRLRPPRTPPPPAAARRPLAPPRGLPRRATAPRPRVRPVWRRRPGGSEGPPALPHGGGRRPGGAGGAEGAARFPERSPPPPGRRGGRGPGPARWRRGREARSGGPARRERGPRALTGPRSGWDGGPVKREGTAAAAKRKLRLPFRRNSWRRRTAAGGRRRRKKEGRNARRHRAASRTEGGRPLLRMRTRWRRKGGSRQRGERARRGHGVRTAGWTAEGGCAAWCRSAVTLPVGWAQQKAKKKKKSRTLSVVLRWESRISASAGAALPAQGPTPPQEQTSSWESLPPVTEAAVINLSRKYSTTHRRRASAAVLKVHVADDCK